MSGKHYLKEDFMDVGGTVYVCGTGHIRRVQNWNPLRIPGDSVVFSPPLGYPGVDVGDLWTAEDVANNVVLVDDECDQWFHTSEILGNKHCKSNHNGFLPTTVVYDKEEHAFYVGFGDKARVLHVA